MLLSFHRFVCFLVFMQLLISSIIPLWSYRNQDIISISLYLLSVILCPNMWSILNKVPLTTELKKYSLDLGWNAPGSYVKCIWFMMLFYSKISVFSFFQMSCLLVRLWYWNDPLSWFLGQSVVSCWIFLLWNWVPLCLVHYV